jgi:hypothetical protein
MATTAVIVTISMAKQQFNNPPENVPEYTPLPWCCMWFVSGSVVVVVAPLDVAVAVEDDAVAGGGDAAEAAAVVLSVLPLLIILEDPSRAPPLDADDAADEAADELVDVTCVLNFLSVFVRLRLASTRLLPLGMGSSDAPAVSSPCVDSESPPSDEAFNLVVWPKVN